MTITLIRGLVGTVHTSTCKLIGEVHKVIAPEIPLDEIGAFLVARELERFACGSCLRGITTTPFGGKE